MVKIAVLVEFNYEELEVWYPLLRFREEGMETFTVGPEAGKTYQSKHGYSVVADKSIDSVKPQDIDALIIPGGFAPDYWRRDKRFVDLVKNAFELGRQDVYYDEVGSPRTFQGKKATCFVAIKDDVMNAGGEYEDSAVVVDGNLITSRVPNDLPEFCKAVIAQLKKSNQ